MLVPAAASRFSFPEDVCPNTNSDGSVIMVPGLPIAQEQFLRGGIMRKICS